VATAIKSETGLEATQVGLLGAVIDGLLDVRVDLNSLDPLGPEELAQTLSGYSDELRQRVVHLIVLGELVLRPIPPVVARRVAAYADELGVDDQFVRIARHYAQGGFGLAWLDLHQSGFAEHWEMARMDQLKRTVKLEHQLAADVENRELADYGTNLNGELEGFSLIGRADPDPKGFAWSFRAGRDVEEPATLLGIP
jgi:hypothetical protein